LHVRAHGRSSTASLDVFYEIRDIVKNPAFDLDPLGPHAYAAPIAQGAFGTGQNSGGFFGGDEVGYFHGAGLPPSWETTRQQARRTVCERPQVCVSQDWYEDGDRTGLQGKLLAARRNKWSLHTSVRFLDAAARCYRRCPNWLWAQN